MKLKYTKGYKYQVQEDYDFNVDSLALVGEAKFIHCHMGLVTVETGYAWDGPSGPTKDTKTNMRASLEHDVLYQLMRLGLLPQSFRKKADLQFDKTAKEDGMSWWRRKYYLFALRKFAGFAANPRNRKKVYEVGK